MNSAFETETVINVIEGIDGYAPAIVLRDLTTAFVTTVIGCLGTASVIRIPESHE